ncbi:MAG TPA: histidine phosphatase family protein, partial [Vicinamibacterales bacterium]|nr:histidine phosphatase family protein [Vicinamibacterales bacterium]
MTTFLLVRHGETDAVDQWLAGWLPGVSLNAKGRRQAARLAERLGRRPVAAIYSSPLDRAMETATPLAEQLGLPIRELDAVGEIRMGAWEGRRLDDLAADEHWRAFNTTRALVRPPGGELMVEVQARMVAALLALAAEHPDRIVVVVSHLDPIRAALMYFLGMPIDAYHRLRLAPASVSTVAIGPGGAFVTAIGGSG